MPTACLQGVPIRLAVGVCSYVLAAIVAYEKIFIYSID